MKKVILTLLTSMICVVLAEAQVYPEPTTKVDTLPQRVVNGLKVIPIKEYFHKTGEIDHWELRVSDFEEKFQHFESKYPGCIDYRYVPIELRDSIADWQDDIWNKVVPAELKTLVKNVPKNADLSILLYINQEGSVFTVVFEMTDGVFQVLNNLPENMMKDLYNNLLKETNKTIEQIKFTYKDDPRGKLGKEYMIKRMNWFFYDQFGTYNPTKLDKITKSEYQRLQQKQTDK